MFKPHKDIVQLNKTVNNWERRRNMHEEWLPNLLNAC